jgi:hypothetical protein
MWQQWLVKLAVYFAFVAVAAGGGVYWGYQYALGQQAKKEIKLETKAAVNTQKLETANAVAAASVIKYITQTVVRTQTITKEVPIVQIIHEPAPTQDCPAMLTGADRLLIDAAASNTDPPTGSGTDAAPVPAYAATTSVVANYGACNIAQRRLIGLQDYVARTLKQGVLCPQ